MIAVIILAGGRGTRMKSSVPKVLHKLTGQTLIESVIKAAQSIMPKQVIVVGSECLFTNNEWINIRNRYYAKTNDDSINVVTKTPITEVLQSDPLGTAHAVQAAFAVIQQEVNQVIILHADVPLIQTRTLRELSISKCDLTLASTQIINPSSSSYGRVILDDDGIPLAIREAKELTEKQKGVDIVNAAIYSISRKCLKACLFDIQNDNTAKEFYFTDIVNIAYSRGFSISHIKISQDEAFGINTQDDLINAPVQRILKEKMTTNGVIMQDPSSIVFSIDTQIESGSTISAFNVFGPNVNIGANVVVHAFCVLSDCTISDWSEIGPFAHIHKESVICSNAMIGNFVEVKKSTIGEQTKAKHLSYLGDAALGKKVNIGAGTVVCNYDGFRKHQTIIRDNASIGANSSLVAPLDIGSNAFVGAGSTITMDVPDETLALSRSKQIHNLEWVRKKCLKK
ncbi:MAG: bifunctional UDP-N-acetylglucosamine diphosphorylase/glucosamine-1-phosphate N-acetyltransferase GlmU [Holosporales bacterium]|jgi:bifunctional UDP-N-acetylglucosamine pyrophosphorylase/glucosamine-1-phosphate N-acetyltransferase|nr:bifunctional UDP-N-acetylglucosamine diphosphorylase/glucosamine-1-phosphate N-acetyltransferase GlmU [Holosporales bacterium]